MEIINSIIGWCISFFGKIFVIFAIISIALVFMEVIYYRIRIGKVRNAKSAPKIAIITGASSGLGRWYAKLIDRDERDIDEIWLIARRKERLESLSSEIKHPVKILPLDLTDMSSIGIIEKKIQESGAKIGILINCAGMGKIGNYHELTLKESNDMMDINDKAAVDVTITAIQFMEAGGRIIEVCSTGAFQPLQHLNIYAASKVFLYNYTRALRMELLPLGIKVTAVCPYWIKDTEFIPIAKDANGHGTGIRNFAFATKAEDVAGTSLRHSRYGFAVSTPGILCFIHRLFSKLIPREALIYIWELIRNV